MVQSLDSAHEKPVVLLVEDEAAISTVLGAILTIEEMSVLHCMNGREALSLLESNSPDLVITDMVMPEVDGLELIRQLKARPNWKTPILAISAMGDYLSQAMRLGADSSLLKPIDLDVFINTVQRLLKSSKTLHQLPHPVRSVSASDQSRIEAIHRLNLNSVSGEFLDHYTQKVARLFQVPMCFVSIITECSQFWTAGYGIPGNFKESRGGHRKDAFCVLPVEASAPLIVESAQKNPIFEENPFVTQYGVRFYAGVPISDFLGHILGTLCLLSQEPRIFSILELQLLKVLSRRVMADFDKRAENVYPGIPRICLRYSRYYDEDLQVGGREAFLDLIEAMARHFCTLGKPLAMCVLVLRDDSLSQVVKQIDQVFPNSWMGKLGTRRLGLIVPGSSSQDVKVQLDNLVSKSIKIVYGELSRAPEMFTKVLSQLEDELGDEGLSQS